MTLKQFLKPDKRKIVIFAIVILFVYSAHYFLGPKLGLAMEDRPEWWYKQNNTSLLYRFYNNYLYSEISSNLFPFNYILGEFYSCGSEPFVETCFDWRGFGPGGYDINLLYFLVFLFTFLVLWYPFSCLIIWIYDKFRKATNK